MLFKGPSLCKINVASGMTSTSRKSISNQGIGHYSSIPNTRTFKGKLTTIWLGPYEVETIFDNGAVTIKTIDDSQNSFVVNGHRLKVYNKPLSKNDFLDRSG
jgi:hypothetical protein